MERKQEEKARQKKELQGHAKCSPWENDQLLLQIEKSRDLGKDVRDAGQAVLPTARNKGKNPAILDDVNTPANDELSSSSSPSLSLSLIKNAREGTKAKSRKRPSHHLAFSDVVSGASRKARRETSRKQK